MTIWYFEIDGSRPSPDSALGRDLALLEGLERKLRAAQEHTTEFTTRIDRAAERVRAAESTNARAFIETMSLRHSEELTAYVENRLRPLERQYAVLRDRLVPAFLPGPSSTEITVAADAERAGTAGGLRRVCLHDDIWGSPSVAQAG
jgi:hypothetical protein